MGQRGAGVGSAELLDALVYQRRGSVPPRHHGPAAEQHLELFGEGRRRFRRVMTTGVLVRVAGLGGGRVLLASGAFTGLPQGADDLRDLKEETPWKILKVCITSSSLGLIVFV